MNIYAIAAVAAMLLFGGKAAVHGIKKVGHEIGCSIRPSKCVK